MKKIILSVFGLLLSASAIAGPGRIEREFFYEPANGVIQTKAFITSVSIRTNSSTLPLEVTGTTKVNGVIWANGNAGGTPTSGSGRRMMWIPAKRAFRAGSAGAATWDDANIGLGSVAFGNGTTASGSESLAHGTSSIASGTNAIAMGASVTASGNSSSAFGNSSAASAFGAFAAGSTATASGNQSVAMGNLVTASGTNSIAMGGDTTQATATNAVAIGSEAIAGADYSMAFGKKANIGAGFSHSVLFNLVDSLNTMGKANTFSIQGGQFIVGGNNPSDSALVELVSTTKGFLPPRMTQAERTAIAPVEGLIVYDTTNNALYVYNGAAWVAL